MAHNKENTPQITDRNSDCIALYRDFLLFTTKSQFERNNLSQDLSIDA